MQNEKHDDCDCICFFVLTHGKIGDNVSAYDMPYPVQMIWQPFSGNSCTSLAGKPKLFFIQVKYCIIVWMILSLYILFVI